MVGQSITLDCLVNINIPSNITLSWSGPISRESVSVVNETSVSDRLVVPAKESYNESVMFCNVSVSGTVYNTSATLTVRGNHWHGTIYIKLLYHMKGYTYYFSIYTCDHAIKNLLLLFSTINSIKFAYISII